MSHLVIDTSGNDLTYRVIGAAMTVHNQIGPGFKEEIYENALKIELDYLGMAALRQHPIPVEYRGEQVAVFFLDLYVEEQVVVEVKALSHQLTNDELAQVINYLKASGAAVGLLFNFGRRSLEYKRIFPSMAAKETVERIDRDNALKK